MTDFQYEIKIKATTYLWIIKIWANSPFQWLQSHQKNKPNCDAKIKSEKVPSSKGSFDCSKCDRVFTAKHRLILHMSRHRTAICPVCSKVFEARTKAGEGFYASGHDQLRWHLRDTHRPRSDQLSPNLNKYECSGCKEAFTCKKVQMKHQSNCKHVRYICPRCSIAFPHQRFLSRHINRSCSKFEVNTNY